MGVFPLYSTLPRSFLRNHGESCSDHVRCDATALRAQKGSSTRLFSCIRLAMFSLSIPHHASTHDGVFLRRLWRVQCPYTGLSAMNGWQREAEQCGTTSCEVRFPTRVPGTEEDISTVRRRIKGSERGWYHLTLRGSMLEMSSFSSCSCYISLRFESGWYQYTCYHKRIHLTSSESVSWSASALGPTIMAHRSASKAKLQLEQFHSMGKTMRETGSDDSQ